MSLYDVINKDKNIEPYSYEEFSRKLMIMGRNQRFSWLLSNVMEYDLTDKQARDRYEFEYLLSNHGEATPCFLNDDPPNVSGSFKD